MADTHQSLLDTSKGTAVHSCKTLYIAISLFAIIFSAVFLVPNLIEIVHPDLSDPSHVCHKALDPKSCLTFISEVVSDEETVSDGITLLQKFLRKYIKHLDDAIEHSNQMKRMTNNHNERVILADCLELMDMSIDRVTDSVEALDNWTTLSHANAQTWLSGVLTNHVTCLDMLGRSPSMGKLLNNLISRARVSLAILAAVSDSAPNEEIFRPVEEKLPAWVTLRDRRLMESSAKDIKADAVVAQDGSGNYRTVAEAIASAPERSKNRYVIYVKRGTYKENVEVGKKKKNVMIVGDGMDLSIITGSLNYVDGTSTFRTATLAAVGDGFILQDICIQNTAGPEKHQAVALRVGADESVINRCQIDAFQDTLYAHSLRQFYRDCYITGTIDFIFGNAAVVFQNCKLVARKPMKSQKNMVTAQGRTDPNQNTGTSIQNCEIIASSDLEPVESSFPSYLGRPWKNYSRTVVMQSYIGGLIVPAGWSVWSGDEFLDTLYYGEFMNIGPGAGTSGRVKWPGYHVITDPAVAMKFTVAELIQGGEWLKSAGVTFTEGL